MDILDITSRYDNTHMPFICKNEHGEELFLFTIRINGAWKIHYCFTDGEVKRLNTGIHELVNECSPTTSYIDGKWHISFVAGGHELSKRLKLYTMKLGDDKPTAIGVSKTGFCLGDENTCAVGAISTFSYPGRHVATQYSIKNSIEMLCIRPTPEPGLLHISFNDVNHEIVTVIYDSNTKQTYRVSTPDGLPLYKGCYYDGYHYFAKKVGEDFEDRVIDRADVIKTEPLNNEYAVVMDSFMSRSLLDINLSNKDMLNLLPEDLR